MMLSASSERPRASDLIKPKNGEYLVALVAGGPHDRFIEVRQEWAQHRGIWAGHHWEYHRPRAWDGNIPRDVDVAFGLNAWMGHSLEAKLRAACQRSNVPYYKVGKGSQAQLAAYGFEQRPPLTICKSSTGQSPGTVEDELAGLGELNATLARLNDEEDLSLDSVSASAPTDDPLALALVRLVQLMPGRAVRHVGVTATSDGGGEIKLTWARMA